MRWKKERQRRRRLLLASLACCVTVARAPGRPSFIAQVAAPGLHELTREFMAYPHDALSFTLPAVELGFLELSGEGSTAAIQDWLYGQAVSTGVGGSIHAITMLYVGLEDGRFLGFKGTDGAGLFFVRGPGAASASGVEWRPHRLSDVGAACREVQSDRAAARRSRTPCRRHPQCDMCLRNSCGSCERSQPAQWPRLSLDEPVDPTVQSVCTGAPSDRWSDMARAHCVLDADGAVCCDGNIRPSYDMNASAARRSSHGDLAGWSIYDHRERSWYIAAKARWETTRATKGWSSIYPSHQSGKYCITATGAATTTAGDRERPQWQGAFGVDYDLDTLSSILVHGLDGIEDTWAYLVERGSGRLIASSTDDAIYSFANSSASVPVRESAARLMRKAWPADRDEAKKVANVGWEAHTTLFEGTHGLDWLIVVGQNLNCSASQIWTFGRCLDCPSGQAPSPDGQECERCPRQGQVPNAQGLCAPCPAGFHADDHQVECELCPAGKYSSSTDLQCLTCEDPTRMVPNGLRTDCECARQHYNSSSNRWRCFDSDWTDGRYGSSVHCDACPPCAECLGADFPPQLKPGFRAVNIGTSDVEVNAFLCASTVESAAVACPGGRRQNVSSHTGRNNVVLPCSDGYEGFLCQSCAEDFHRTGHLCAQCVDDEVSSAVIALLVMILLAAGWKYVGKAAFASRLEAYLANHESLNGEVSADTAAAEESVENPLDNLPCGREDGDPLPRNDSSEQARPRALRGRSTSDVGMVVRDSARKTVSSLAAADPDKVITVAFRSMFTPVRTVITYAQVTAQIGRVLHIELPGGYMLDIINACKPLLETWELVISMDCAGYSGFYSKWFAKVVFLPSVCLVVIFVLFCKEFRKAWQPGGGTDVDLMTSAKTTVKTRIFFAIFFLYPTICNALFACFNCRLVGEGTSLLVDDDRILCDSPDHQTYQNWSYLLIVGFAFGVPGVVFYSLYMRRRKYKKHQEENRELVERVCKKLEMTDTKANVLVQEVRAGQDVAFLLQSYKPTQHYWECWDMLRKLILVGLVLLVGRGSPLQVLVAVLMSGAFLCLHVKQWPFKDTYDNVFRMLTEIHVFITFTVCLALRGETRDGDDPSTVEFENQVTWGTFVAFVLLVPFAFVVTVGLKLRHARELMDREQPSKEERLRHSAHRVLRGFGDDQDAVELSEMFKRIEGEIENDEKVGQLTDSDRRTLKWVREELDFDEGMEDLDTIRNALDQLQLPQTEQVSDDKGVDASSEVRKIREAIVAKTAVEDGVFLSHYQMYGPDVMDLKSSLVEAGIRDEKIWYDKDNDPSERNMRLGVRNSRYFLLYLTEGVLERPFCRKEIRWCLMYKKEVILLWKLEGKGSIASFARFFADCSKQLASPHEDSHEDLISILGTAAIPYYLSGEFRDASMSKLLQKLNHAQAVQAEATLGFAGPPPMVHVGYNREKLSNARAVRDGLTRLAPQLVDQVSLGLRRGTALGGAHTSAGDVVLVYLTEGLFDDSEFVAGLKELLKERQQAANAAKRLRRGLMVGGAERLPIVWVAESDMRHGWSEYQNADWEGRKEHGWQDALRDLQTHIAEEHPEFFTNGWIKPETFDEVIPFYKDLTFRKQSLAIILKKIGAQQMAEGEIAAMVGAGGGGGSSEDGEQRSRDGRAISFGDGSAALTRQVAAAYDDAGALARNETV